MAQIEPMFNKYYQAAAAADVVVKNKPGFLHAIIVGEAKQSGVIEVSDSATDGDGNVKIYLKGDTLGPATYLVNARFDNGITADITTQTHVTFIFR